MKGYYVSYFVLLLMPPLLPPLSLYPIRASSVVSYDVVGGGGIKLSWTDRNRECRLAIYTRTSQAKTASKYRRCF